MARHCQLFRPFSQPGLTQISAITMEERCRISVLDFGAEVLPLHGEIYTEDEIEGLVSQLLPKTLFCTGIAWET